VFVVKELLGHPLFKEGVHWKGVTFKKDEKIVSLGDTSKDLYWLKKGAARVLGSVDVGDSRRIQPGVCDIKVGDVFGELALFDQQPRSATVISLEETEVVIIDGDELMLFLENNSDIGFGFMCDMMDTMVKRLRASNEKVFSLFAWGLKAHKIDEHLP